MLHGDLVTITKAGVLVREKAVQDLGIHDQSQCWGLWVENPIKDPARSPDRLRDHRHLIISPFHPKSWPYLLRVQLWLPEAAGALSWASEALNECGLSIIFAECTPSGFTHATWTVVAEVVEPRFGPPAFRSELETLRKDKETLDDELPKVHVPDSVSKGIPAGGAFESCRKLLARTAAWMLIYRRMVKQRLHEISRPDEPDRVHLFDWSGDHPLVFDKSGVEEEILRYGPSLDDLPDEITTQSAKRWRTRAFPRSATVKWIPHLANFAFYGAGSKAAIPMRYDSNRASLALLDPSTFDVDGFLGSTRMPIPAIASFSDRFKYIRVDPITDNRLAGELTLISVEYAVRAPSSAATTHSMGLLHRICRVLTEQGVDLLHLSNKWTEYRAETEAGKLLFVADAAPSCYADIEAAVKSIALAGYRRSGSASQATRAGASSTDPFDSIRFPQVAVSRYPSRRLFLSLHFGNPREETVHRLIEKLATEHGFDLVIVQTHLEEAPRRVLEELRRSDAVLQVLSFGRGEDPETSEFPWLDYEFGLAAGLEIPAIRMVDIVRVPRAWWERKIRTKRDVSLMDFRTDSTDAELETNLRHAIAELSRWLVSHSR